MNKHQETQHQETQHQLKCITAAESALKGVQDDMSKGPGQAYISDLLISLKESAKLDGFSKCEECGDWFHGNGLRAGYGDECMCQNCYDDTPEGRRDLKEWFESELEDR